MLKSLGDGLLAGLGAVVLTREKIEEATRKLVEKGRLSRDEAAKLNEELVEKGEGQWKLVEDTIVDRLHAGRERLGIGSQQDVNALLDRVNALENRISVVETRVSEHEASHPAPSA